MRVIDFSSTSAAALILLSSVSAASAQGSGLFIDRGRLDSAPPQALPSAPAPRDDRPAAATPEDQTLGRPLRAIALVGETDPAALAAINVKTAALSGKPITQALLREIIAAIGAYYAEQNLVLQRAVIPNQDFTEGRVQIVILQGYIQDIAIEGAEGRNAALLLQQAQALRGAKPLRRAAFERAILLMNDTPGQHVTPSFEQAGADPNAVRLKLKVARRPVQFGASVNNEGQSLLGRTQYDTSAVVNGLALAGDNAQIYYGFPAEFERYQFYALSYSAFLPGYSGARWSLTASKLKTDPGALSISGRANTLGAQISYPLQRTVARTTMLSASMDTLSSSNAFLGNVISDDRTRVLRGSVSHTRAGKTISNSASATASFGLDAFDANVNAFYGGPEFAKLNLRFAHDRRLGDRLRVKLTAAAQIAEKMIPPSERLQFGGATIGRGFDSGFASAPRGLTASAQADRIVDIPAVDPSLAQGALFAFADAGHLFADKPFGLPERDLVSLGAGGVVTIKQALSLVTQIAQPIEGGRTTGDERFLFTIRAAL